MARNNRIDILKLIRILLLHPLQKVLILHDRFPLKANPLSFLLELLQLLLLPVNLPLLLLYQLLLLLDLLVSLAFLAVILLQEDGELDHALLDQQVFVAQLFFLLLEKEFGLLALLLLGFVF